MGSSLTQAELNFANRKFVVGKVVDDTPVAIRIRHTGAVGRSVTSVTVTAITGIILIETDGTTPLTTTITWAASATIGAVADLINAATNWECKVLDALRADASDNNLVDGAISATNTDGVSYYDCLQDTSVLQAITYRCAYNRGVALTKPNLGHRVHLQQFMHDIVHNGAEVNGVRVYEWDAEHKTETQIWRAVSPASGVATTENFASGEGMITSGVNNDLIVRLQDSTSLTDDDANYMEVSYIRE